jgi:hypothetical protein
MKLTKNNFQLAVLAFFSFTMLFTISSATYASEPSHKVVIQVMLHCRASTMLSYLNVENHVLWAWSEFNGSAS